jgi:maltose alpha-D-glucosyltransferase/alpha-amylase
VEAQLANPHSLLWWMRRLLALRKRWRALGEGKCEFLQPENRKILSYLLRHQEETLLIVANLSRFVQPVELDLSGFKQRRLVELFGRMEFPAITERPYFLTLGPHAFYWFSIEAARAADHASPLSPTAARQAPISVTERWQEVLVGKARNELEAKLPAYLQRQTWFLGKQRAIKSATIKQDIAVPLPGEEEVMLTHVQVEYMQGDAETYSLPLAFAHGAEAERLKAPHLAIAEVSGPKDGLSGMVYDALSNPGFCKTLLELVTRRHRLKDGQVEVEATRTAALRRILGGAALPEPTPDRGDQSNSFVVYGDKFFLKFFRRLEPGLNPELETGRFLTEKEFSGSPALGGGIELARAGEGPTTLAVLSAFVPNARTARDYALDALSRYYDRVMTWVAERREAPPAEVEPMRLLYRDIPPAIKESIGTFLESSRLLGQRTAELHVALSSAPETGELAPEPFTPHYQRSLFQSMRSLAVQNFQVLRKQLKALAPESLPMAQRVAELQPAIIERYRALLEHRISAKRIRIHGDCHLGQVLWTGREFVFIDFEGPPAMALSERRIKRSPLQDVAGLVRSFHYAAYAGLYQHVERGSIPHENLPKFESWVRLWNLWVSVTFLRAYLRNLGTSGLLPGTEADLRVMLEAYLLNHMVKELGDELSHRSVSVRIPLQGILYLTGAAATARL